jgi:DNA-binding NarL/FixJ family response regulator
MASPKGSSIAKKVNPGQAKRVHQSRVLLVDDHPVVREGLARVIEQAEDLTVCGEAENSLAALQAAQTLAPDMAIVDVTLNGANGFELVKDLKVHLPHLPILMLSMHDESLYAERALQMGAQGYVMKQEPPQILLKAIRQVLRGDVYLSASMTGQVLRHITSGEESPPRSPVGLLSNREFEVFEKIGQVYSTKQIAEILHLSVKTVETHREHIKQKLNLKDSSSLVRFAVQWVNSSKQ